MQRRLLPVIAGLCLLLAPAAAGAQNREHQQIVADLRMLHEQLQQLKLTVNTLIEQLAATNTRLDAQGDATRKDFADLRVLVNQLTGDMSTLPATARRQPPPRPTLKRKSASGYNR
jgi:hypothetical protein